MSEHFPADITEEALTRALQRDLKVLKAEGKVVTEIKKGNAELYHSVQIDENEGIDQYIWSYLMNNFQHFLGNVVPAKRLDAALQHLRDSDAGIRLDENFFQVAPDTLNLLPADFNPVHLSTILLALDEGKAIEVVYQYRLGGRAQMILHPQGAVQSGPRFFLFALAGDEEVEVKTYALQRFASVKITDQPAGKAQGFDLKKAVEARDPDPARSQKIQLELLTRSFVTDLLRDCPLSTDQQIFEDEPTYGFDARVTATVVDSLLLERWLLGRGTNLCVLKPVHLGQRIARKARIIAQQHEELYLRQQFS